MNRESARAYLREHWRDYARKHWKVSKDRKGFVCPFCKHGGGGDGLVANPKSQDGNSLHCFGCGRSGDIIDFYAEEHGLEFRAAFEGLALEMGITLDPYTPEDFRDLPEKIAREGRFEAISGGEGNNTTQEKKHAQTAPTEAHTQETDFTEYYNLCAERLEDPRAVDYLMKRGISIPTAKKCQIGFDPAADPASVPGSIGNEYKPNPAPRIIIPSSRAHYVGRAISPDTPSNLRKLNNKGGHPDIFNAEALFRGAEAVFVTEGGFDALSFLEAGAEAVALNSTSNAEHLLTILQQRGTDSVLILCLDQDPAGQRATETIRDGLSKLGIANIISGPAICEGYKDPNERLVNDRSGFITAVREAERIANEVKRETQEANKEKDSDALDRFFEIVQSEKYRPQSTGCAEIDAALGGGIFSEQLYLLGAAPGMGKTTFVSWIVENMARQGRSTLFLNLEMAREQLLARSLSRIVGRSGVLMNPLQIMQGYSWTVRQREAVKEAIEEYKREIGNRVIYNPDKVTSNLDRIIDYINEMAVTAEKNGEKAPVVVLDYLQILQGKDREDNTELMKRAVNSIKGYAIAHKTSVIAIIAHNRESIDKGTAGMTSGRDTSAIEYSADCLLGMTYTALGETAPEGMKRTPETLSKEDRKRITLKIIKNRFFDPNQAVPLQFSPETMTYTFDRYARTAREFSDLTQKTGRKKI